MQIQLMKPQFIKVSKSRDYGALTTFVFRVDHIDYINVTTSTIYFLDKTSVTNITRESMERLQSILLDSSTN